MLPDAPSSTVTAVTEFIQKNYPNARIIEIEQEKGMIEVDIVHENQSKEVLFNISYEWISTSWDVYVLPIKVTEAINASQYSGYVVDDAEYVETLPETTTGRIGARRKGSESKDQRKRGVYLIDDNQIQLES